MTRQVAFACNIARPQARDTPRSGHPAPTSLYCQPDRIHLPAPHQANPPSAQHSAGDQEWAETARKGSLTVPFTARTSPVQATSRARQPAPAARRYLFQSSFHLRPTVGFTCRRDKQDSTAHQHQIYANRRRIPTPKAVRCKRCWALTPAGARHPCPQAPFSRLARCGWILPHSMIFIAQRQAKCNNQNTR